jgi:hypothetical protein
VNVFKRVSPRLQIGAEWNPAANELGPVANWVVSPESEHRPMISLGTSSDRIFSPPGYQSYYATFAKRVGKVSPYVSLFYSEWERGFIFPFGVTIPLNEHWELLPMNDGRNTHVLLTHKLEKMSMSFMLVKMRHPGLSLGFSF